MSDTKEPKESRPRRAVGIGCFALALVGLPIFFLMMIVGIGPGFVELGFTELFGWVSFLIDTMPRVSWNWGAIMFAIGCRFLAASLLAALFAIGCSAFVLFVGHHFATWLSRGFTSARGISFVWPLRWTLCCFAIMGIGFLVAMSVAGVAHQVGWIVGSNDSLFEDRFASFRRRYSEMSAAEYAARESLDNATTVAAFRTAIRRFSKTPNGGPLAAQGGLESVHLLMMVGSEGSIDSVLIFPRDPRAQERLGGKLVTTGGAARSIPGKQLRQFVNDNEKKFVAF